jgi:dsRNA-specific ribonuclease
MQAISEVSSQPEWVTNICLLQRKIHIILRSVIDPSHINALLDQDALIKYWTRTFTHKSVDADPQKNYETYEFYGDKVMNDTFSDHCRTRFGDEVNQANGTLLMNKYMSKEFQAGLAEQLGLPEYVRFDITKDININVKEDVLESFFGCLKILADDRIYQGLGYVYCLNLMNHIFNNIPIVLEDIRKDPVTLLKERFEKLSWGQPQYDYKNSENPSLGEVRAEIRDGNTGKLLGVGYGSKPKAEAAAAQNALQVIEAQGYTLEYADAYRLERQRTRNPEFDKQYRRLEAAIEKLNVESQKARKVQISQFKIISAGSHRGADGQRYTFAINCAYKGPDGNLIWKIIKQRTGDDQDNTKIQLMKEVADQFQIPEEI